MEHTRILCLLVPDFPEENQKDWESLLREANRISPSIESINSGLFYADLRGLGPLFGGEGGIIAQFVTLIKRQDLPSQMGLAGSRFTAFIAAHNTTNGSCRVIPTGRDASFLAPFPIELLPWDKEDLATFGTLGIRKLGDLANLNRQALKEAFGNEARSLILMARGLPMGPLRLYEFSEVVEECIQFPERVKNCQRLLFCLLPAIEALVQRLGTDGLACLRFALHLEPGNEYFEANLSRPSPSVRILRDRLRHILSNARLSQGVTKARLEVLQTAPFPSAQGSLFPVTGSGEGAVAATVAQLEERLGQAHVFSPRLIPEHSPEKTWMAQPWGQKSKNPQSKVRKGVTRPISPLLLKAIVRSHHRPSSIRLGPLTLRIFNPPKPAMVQCLNGFPSKVQIGTLTGKVRHNAGPFPLSGAWWKIEVFDRRYHDIELHGGELLCLFQNRLTGQWFLQGIYD